jgi:glycine cleavage system H protein
MGSVESVKAVADVNCPVSGRVIEANSALDDSPESINQSPYGDGWLAKIELSDMSEIDGLLNSEAYQAKLPAGK